MRLHYRLDLGCEGPQELSSTLFFRVVAVRQCLYKNDMGIWVAFAFVYSGVNHLWWWNENKMMSRRAAAVVVLRANLILSGLGQDASRRAKEAPI